MLKNFDYSKLKGRIMEKGFTQKTIAKEINMSKSTFSLKINNKTYFVQDEIFCITKLLDIPAEHIKEYFFEEKV